MKTLKITVLTQESCAYCDSAKAVLDQLASEYPLSIATLSLDLPDGRELAEGNGILFPPGIFIDGEAFSYGRLSEKKLRREIQRRLAGDRHAP